MPPEDYYNQLLAAYAASFVKQSLNPAASVNRAHLRQSDEPLVSADAARELAVWFAK